MKNDLLFVFRSLLSRKPYTVVIVLTLSLGLGLTTTAYSVVYGRFLRGLPFPDSDRVMRIAKLDAKGSELGITLREFRSWQGAQQSFEQLSAWQGLAFDLSGPEGPPERVNGACISEQMLQLVHVPPVLGRDFSAEDHRAGAPPVVILGHSLWSRRFGGRDVIGTTVKIYGRPTTIIGVMPPDFLFPIKQSLWLPLAQSPQLELSGEDLAVQVLGRLKDQAGAREAQAELALLSPAGSLPAGGRVAIQGYTEAYTNAQLRHQHWMMLAAVLGLLLLCGANVANLMLGRTLERHRELALRTALGASRRQLVRLLLLESCGLAVASGVLGLLIAKVLTANYLLLAGDRGINFWSRVTLDWHVFAAAFGITALIGVACGMVPAFGATHTDPVGGLRHGSRVHSRGATAGVLERLLVVGQIALCIGLLTATGLVVKSFYSLQQTHFGFAADRILFSAISLYGSDFPDSASRLRAFDEIQEAVQRLPGVEAAGCTFNIPGVPASTVPFGLEGTEYAEGSEPSVLFSVVTPGFFQAFDLATLQGRLLDATDTASSEPAVIVNSRFAATYFPGEAALGKKVRVGGALRTVVGVVPNMLIGKIEGEQAETLFLPLSQYPLSSIGLVIKTTGPPQAWMPQVRHAVGQIAPNQPLINMRPMTEVMAEATRFYRASTLVFTVLGALATLLALLGLYANLSSFVSRKAPEIGIRMAIGASRQRIITWTLRQGGALLGLGLALGLAVGLSFIHVMKAFLFKMQPWDPGLFTVVACSLFAAGILACLMPALRAARLDPLVVLRAE